MQTTARFATAFFAALAVSGVSTPASAQFTDNMYPTSHYNHQCVDGALDFCKTDNSALTFCFEGSMPSTARTAVRNVMTRQFAPTDLSTEEKSSCSYTGGSETDIVYQVSALPAGILGLTWCDDAVTSSKCDQHYVRFTSGSWAADARVICHESGHAVGLTHGHEASPAVANSDLRLGCMASPVSYTSTALGPNSYYWINSTY